LVNELFNSSTAGSSNILHLTNGSTNFFNSSTAGSVFISADGESFIEFFNFDKEQVARLTASPWPRSDQALDLEQGIRFRPLELSRLHA
jgi:hypothetical protein